MNDLEIVAFVVWWMWAAWLFVRLFSAPNKKF